MVARDQSPWDVLGIAAGAGVADIRRAYARRLRDIRPDEDAEGFQQLVEARDLALQLASGARQHVPPAREIVANIVDASPDDVVDLPSGPAASLEREPPTRPASPPVAPAAHRPPPVAPAADPEISAPPTQSSQDALDALHGALNTDGLAGWQAAVGLMSALSHQQRAALEPRIIAALCSFVAQESGNLAAWPPSKWPFFDLIAALDEEFGWRENDRVLYEILGEQEAQDFTALLRWTRTLLSGEADSTDRGEPIAFRDLHAFYNDGRDQRGLDAYWAVVNDPKMRFHDIATYLFFPVWRWRAGALLGLLGWAVLILPFAPWRLAGGGTQSNMIMEAFALVLPLCLAFAYMPVGQLGAVWDSLAFFLFPVWALARRLYVWAAIGLIAWIAIAYQLSPYGGSGLLAFGAVFQAMALHVTAGACGQRWIVYHLKRSIAAADRRRIFEPQQRASFLRRHGTGNQSLQPTRPRKKPRAGSQDWWKWLVLVAAISAIIRLVDALLRLH